MYLSTNELMVPPKPKPGILKKLKTALCAVILYGTLLLIALLAIPACALIGLIGLIWSLADGLLKLLDRWERPR